MSHCEDCRFYTPFPDRKGWGYCHRYPPSGWRATSLSLSAQFSGRLALKTGRAEELGAKYEGKIKGLWEQPQMEPQDWCGEYQPKTEAEELSEPSMPAPAEDQ
jgi:hypothetical protein